MTEIVSIERDGADVARSSLERTIAAGGVAIFPADGIYGLACDPLNVVAIDRIQGIKGRDEGKSSAIMYFSPLAMCELIEDLGPHTRRAAGSLLPGPVTLVVYNPLERYPLACREDRTRLGVRLIDGPLAGAMCPLFQTSANLSGEWAPRELEEVKKGIVAAVDLAIDGGRLPGLPSTVVDLTSFDEDGEWEVLREGGLSVGDLAARLTAVWEAD
jgi:L-threonylcarbamoyladenylate synthase